MGKDRASSSLLDSSDFVSRERLLAGVECRDEVREELGEGERRSGSEYWFLRSGVYVSKESEADDGERIGPWKGDPSRGGESTSAMSQRRWLNASLAVTVRGQW